MTTPQARILNLPLATPLTTREGEDIASFNEAFPHDELHVVPNGKSVEVHLRAVDLDKAKDLVQELKAEKPHPLLEVVEEIHAIGSYGLRGRKRVYAGFNAERKVKDRAQKELRRGKFYYARDSQFSKENTEVPSQFVDKIMCGDSLEVLRQLPDNCVDLVFTSPPYNFGLDYNNNADDHDWDRYFQFLFAILDECIRVIKYGGRIIVNVQPLFSDYIPTHHIIGSHLMNRGLIWKSEILWEKNNYNCKYTAWGSWKSPSNPYMKYSWEFLEVFCKGDLKKQREGKESDITGDEFKKWVYGKWSIAPERKMKHYGHPAMFPEALALRVLRLFSFQGDLVLDPFVGVGTTSVVAKKTGRHYLGIDISPEYCKTAEARLAQDLGL